MSDKELLEAISLRDESAFRLFYEKYNRLLYKWAYNRMGNIEMTEECLQNFWIAVWTEPDKIKTNDKGIAKNFLLHHFTYRILNYIKYTFLNESDKMNSFSIDEVQESLPYSHVEEEFDVREINTIITRLIQNLPEKVQEAFELAWQKGYSAKEIAAELKIDERTAAYKIKSGLSLISKSIDKVYNLKEPAKNKVNLNLDVL